MLAAQRQLQPPDGRELPGPDEQQRAGVEAHRLPRGQRAGERFAPQAPRRPAEHREHDALELAAHRLQQLAGGQDARAPERAADVPPGAF